MKHLILVRGISGSGKSTFAKKLKSICESENQKVVHYETDDFFMVDGVYHFDANNLHKFHQENKNRTFDALNNTDIDTVIVSNTFVRMREITPYVEYAINNNIQVSIFEMTTSFENQHGVTKEHIERMKNRFVNQSDVERFFENQIKYFKVNQDV